MWKLLFYRNDRRSRSDIECGHFCTHVAKMGYFNGSNNGKMRIHHKTGLIIDKTSSIPLDMQISAGSWFEDSENSGNRPKFHKNLMPFYDFMSKILQICLKLRNNGLTSSIHLHELYLYQLLHIWTEKATCLRCILAINVG